jgi:ribosomal protein S18 acetylase RimI-like enzyme
MASHSSNIRLRPLRPDDRDFYYRARRAAFKSYFDEIRGSDEEEEERARADRQLDELPIQIIEQAGSRIGYICVLHEEDHDFIKEIALVPEVQGRGIGSQVIRDVMKSANMRGVSVRLSVRADNPARRVYEQLGFQLSRIDHPRIKMEWRPARRS